MTHHVSSLGVFLCSFYISLDGISWSNALGSTMSSLFTYVGGIEHNPLRVPAWVASGAAIDSLGMAYSDDGITWTGHGNYV
jgi:hypothetical protein